MTTNSKEYTKQYVEKNREKIRIYKRDWKRNHRQKKCLTCEILLSSKSAGKSEGDYCEEHKISK